MWLKYSINILSYFDEMNGWQTNSAEDTAKYY